MILLVILIKFPSRRDDDVEYYGLRIMRDEATVYPFPFPGCAQRLTERQKMPVLREIEMSQKSNGT